MRSFLITLLMAVSLLSSGQYYYMDGDNNPIRTAVDYLLIALDARSVGTGESGGASSPDIFSMYWNPAKYAFFEDRFGIAVSFSNYPWMNEMYWFNKDLELSIGFNALHGCWKINDRSALASSFTYYKAFTDVTFTDEFGNQLGTFEPYDLNVDLAYSYRFSDNLSAALAGRYIFSKMIQGQFVQGAETKNASAVAFDMAVYYRKPLSLGSKEGELRLGAGISNIGNKISYVFDADNKRFIPTNLRLGAGFTYRFSEDHSLSCQLDANKLLVPTPPIYMVDSFGLPVYDDEGDLVIAEGMDPNVSVFRGMIQSWYDAPGGLEEEWHEWAFGGGFEYRYKTIFSGRTGIFYENKTKGYRRFFTAGAGFKAGVFEMDMGVKVPIDRAIKDDYFSIFYLRSSIAISVP